MQVCPKCQFQNTGTALFCRGCGQPLGARAQATGMLLTGALLQGRYRIVALIGTGGMAAVYRAEDLRLPGVRWAIKEMSDAKLTPAEKQEALANFEQEARLLATLRHPNLPQVADYFHQAGKQYLVMEFVNGQTLEEIVEATKPRFLDERQVLGWLGQVCDVLTYLHGQQPPIIFRDLKPDNIMLDRRPLKGASGQIKLIDFGIARHFKPGKTADTQPMGTPGYAAPEAYGRGQTDVRSDVYSLGVTLHALLTRHDPATTPFALPPVRSLNPAVSPHIEGIIQRATQMDQDHRYQSAAEMKQALFQSAPRRAQAATPPPPLAPGAAQPAPTGATRPVPIPGRSAPPPLPPRTGPTRSVSPPLPGRRPPPQSWSNRRIPAWLWGAGLILCLILALGGLLLVGGGSSSTYVPPPIPTTRTPTATRTPTPSPGPTRTWTPTPPRLKITDVTPTSTQTPIWTSTPTTTPPAPCDFQAQGFFAGLWQTHRERLGCPLQRSPQAIQDAEQPFQNGHMLWRMDTRQIYVIYEQGSRAGTFQVFGDQWREGQPEYACSASPPPGLVQPERGFGLVWCNLGAASAPIGWGLVEEQGFGGSYGGDPLVQDFEGGAILRDNDGAARGLAYVFFDDGTFVRVHY